MHALESEDVWVLGMDGTVQLASGGAEPEPGWLARATEAMGRSSRIDLPEGIVQVRDLRAVGGADERLLRLVSLRRRPAWLSGVRLTPRQKEVCVLASHGATVGEIASHLEISRHTVRTHLKTAYRALDVANRVELAAVVQML